MNNKETWVCDSEGHYQFETPPKAKTILQLASLILQKKFTRGDSFERPESVEKFLCYEIGAREQEVFCCLFLDNRHRLINFEILFYGTIAGATVHPREVVKRALKVNASAVIFGHNHPSGVPEPSQSDIALTTKLKDALDLVEVRVLDHIVVGGDDTVSMSTRGLI